MFSELLKKYRKLGNLTQGQLASQLSIFLGYEIKPTNVQSWERGINPKLEIITSIAEILKVPVQFLFDDSKETINQIVKKEMPNFKNVIDHTKEISLLDGYCGAGSSADVNNLRVMESLYVDNYMIKKAYRDEDIKALTIIGDSMSPYVNCQDIILFAPLNKGQYNLTDGKYIISTINGVMVKNLSFRCNGDIIISSENKAYTDEIIKANETQEYLDIVGIVVGRILKS